MRMKSVGSGPLIKNLGKKKKNGNCKDLPLPLTCFVSMRTKNIRPDFHPTNLSRKGNFVFVELTQRYVNEFGIGFLKRNLSITTSSHSNFPSLLHLQCSAEYTPWVSKIGAECEGMILEEKTELNSASRYSVHHSPLHIFNIKLVFCPPRRLDSHEYEHAPHIDWSEGGNNLSFFPWLDGYTTSLYNYNDAWQVGSKNSADGSCFLFCGGKPFSLNYPFIDICRRKAYGKRFILVSLR